MPSVDDFVTAPVLPAPAPRRGRLPFFGFFRTLRENKVATYGEEAYERDIVERTMFGRHRFLVNEPAAIKHVLLDNAANYQKTEITRRILEPGLGKGLITTEGETWRQHRRTMSPSFDHRSIASYAPVITGAAQQLLADWDRLGADTPVEVATAMMEATLAIISRTMFSSDSDRMVAIMERSAGRYQAQMRPNMMDFLRFPRMARGFGQSRGRRSHARRVRYGDRSSDRTAVAKPRRRTQGFARPPDSGTRRANGNRHDRAGGARSCHHHLHGGS